jgi:penicillin-binding protein 1B
VAVKKSVAKVKRKPFISFLFKLSIVLAVAALAWIVYLDATVRYTFAGKKWTTPAFVYARPLELYAGLELNAANFDAELKLLGYQFVKSARKPRQVSKYQGRYELMVPVIVLAGGNEPARSVSLTINSGVVTKLSTSDRESLIRLEPVKIGGIYPAHNEDRLLVQLSEVPDTLEQMLIAVEDRSFYKHGGVSLISIARAAYVNITKGSVEQGGSTLTQQLVKNYFLTNERTLSRKLKEAVMALLLEFHASKDEILEGYINEIYLGQDGPRAVHGFGLASQYYFGKPIDGLSLSQQAALIAVVRGPSYYNPWRHGKRVLMRRDRVLDIAVREGAISENTALRAKIEPLGLGEKAAPERRRYPAYLDLVRRQLQQDYDDEDLINAGLSVHTYLDPVVQIKAEKSLANKLKALSDSDGKLASLEGAVVVTRPNTGNVVAVVGGKNVQFAGFNRALDARRQVGSLIKPAVYLTALQQYKSFNLATLLDDSPLTEAEGSGWFPQNYDKKNHGDVMLFRAMANSYNQSTARLGLALGVDAIAETMAKLGVEREVPRVPSLTLGVAELSPLEVAQMYQTIAGEGFYTPLNAIDTVITPQGEAISRYPLKVEQRFDKNVIYLLRYAMEAVTTSGTGKALKWLLPDFAVAGKTGSSSNLRDSWFAGFSGDMLSVVWIGNDDGAPTTLTGSSGALRVWAKLMADSSRLPVQNIPPHDIEFLWVGDNKMAKPVTCANGIPLPFIQGSTPVGAKNCTVESNKLMDAIKRWLSQ